MYFNATFYYTVNGLVAPVAEISDVTLDSATEDSVQMIVTRYSADSLLLALDEMELFNFVIDGSLL